MSAGNFSRQRDELLKLLELDDAERTSRLKELAKSEPELHSALVSLLRHQKTPAAIVEDGALAAGLGAGLAETLEEFVKTVPDQIGPYIIHEVLGEGGMGVVYRAEQTAPLKRQVAIKHIRLGMDTNRIVARFQTESQSLARMNHPHIASVFNAGIDDKGRSYFVMELVDGPSITTWCRENSATLAERLNLFLVLCDAVQHAHQKGIIHRDLKPGNLLVATLNDKPHPKIIDFGIAKALHETDDDMTLDGTYLGTPRYMSPEQLGAFGGGADTRSDVYALGVILYELITDHSPYEMETSNPEEMRRIVLEERPANLSSKLDGRKGRELQDLNNIVLMALRKDPDRRYSSVDQFADDIHHFRKGEPVIARANSWRYRSGKFIARHRMALGVMAVFVVLLLSFTATVVAQADRTRRQRDRAVVAEKTAVDEAASAQEVANFLVDLIASANPEQTRGKSLTVKEVVDQGAQQIRNDLEARPAIQWRLLATLGDVYLGLGLMDKADTLLTQTLELQLETLGAESTEITVTLEKLGTVAHGFGDYTLATQRYKQALDMILRLEGKKTAKSAYLMNSLAIAQEALGEYKIAEPLYEEALALNRELLGDVDPEVAWGLNTLGQIRWRMGEYDGAQKLFQEAVDLARSLYGHNHSDLCAALNNLGGCMILNGEHERAVIILQEALADYQTIYGDKHPGVGRGHTNLANALQAVGRTDEALAHYEQGLAIQLDTVGLEHLYYAKSLAAVGLCRVKNASDDAGLAQGIDELRLALDLNVNATNPDHPTVASQSLKLAEGLIVTNELEEAEIRAQRTLAIHEKRLGTEHPLVAQTKLVLALVYEKKGEDALASRWTEDAFTILNSTLGADHFITQQAGTRLQNLTKFGP